MLTVMFETRLSDTTLDKGVMQFSDVHEMNKYIRELCYPDFWTMAGSSFIWQDIPATLCMDIEEDRFALKGVDWELGRSYKTDLTYHVIGV
jgi:hypothetical protein